MSGGQGGGPGTMSNYDRESFNNIPVAGCRAYGEQSRASEMVSPDDVM